MKAVDVIVVGGGLAGVCAAGQALRAGAETALISKGKIGAVGGRGSGASGCGATELGRPSLYRLLDASFDADRFRDMIINAGLGMLGRDMASFFVEELVRMKPLAGEIMGCYNRPSAGCLGTPLVRSRFGFVRKHARLFEEITVADILVRDGTCHGVVCVNESTAETFALNGKAVILAAGGDAGLFSVNVHPNGVAGDGYALGLRAGAEAINLEFMQIFAMTTAPTRNLVHFRSEEALAHLSNREGEEFLPRYLPPGVTREACVRENILHAPFSVRDRASRYLAIGIVAEIKAGRGTPSGGIYVDLRDCPLFKESIQDRFFRSRGIDGAREPLEVSMGFQCCNGGIRVNRRMDTTVRGLYAVGENAGGLHGADRIGGNMLAGCMISGRIAGEQAAEYACKAPNPDRLPHATATLLAADPEKAARFVPLIAKLRQSAWDNLLVVKSTNSVNRFRALLTDIERETRAAAEDPDALPVEVRNLLILGKALTAATMEREESRGGFYREDHPTPSAGVPKAHVISLSEEGEVLLRKEVLDPAWDPEAPDILVDERWG